MIIILIFSHGYYISMYNLFKQKSHFNAEIHILLFSMNFKVYCFTLESKLQLFTYRIAGFSGWIIFMNNISEVKRVSSNVGVKS